MRTTRGLVLVVLTATVLTVGAASSALAGGKSMRSGTIVGGGGVELSDRDARAENPLERSGCQYAVDCLTWLNSGCNPTLAGRDPVLTASIVDVGNLAGGTLRTLTMRAPTIPPWGLYPGAVIQFWRQDCTEIPHTKLHNVGEKTTTACRGFPLRGGPGRCTFRIPAEATWMTLSGYATTVGLSWSLD